MGTSPRLGRSASVSFFVKPLHNKPDYVVISASNARLHDGPNLIAWPSDRTTPELYWRRHKPLSYVLIPRRSGESGFGKGSREFPDYRHLLTFPNSVTGFQDGAASVSEAFGG